MTTAPPSSNSLIFVGPLTYTPNRLAVKWLIDRVLPKLIERIPEAELLVVGDPAGLAVAHGEMRGVRFTGWVPDVTPFYRTAGVAVTPLHSGGGTRLKVVEALARRVPLVSTSFGCEGLGLLAGEEMLVADEPDEFAAACASILEDPQLRQSLVSAGVEPVPAELHVGRMQPHGDRGGPVDDRAIGSRARSLARRGPAAMTATSDADGAWTVNAARDNRWPRLQLSQPWVHRELIFFFALRDVKVRYKQAYLGAAWAALQPIAGAVAFTLLFNELAGVEVEDESYFVFALVGFVVWAYFTTAVNNGTNILLYNSELLTKVALPRIAFPVSALLPGLIELAVGVVIALVAAMIWGGGTNVVALVVGAASRHRAADAQCLGPALFFSACVVRYRDVATIVGFGLQLFLFVSPVAYPPELVPDRWQTLQYVNPLAGALALFRAALGGSALPAIGLLAAVGAQRLGDRLARPRLLPRESKSSWTSSDERAT